MMLFQCSGNLLGFRVDQNVEFSWLPGLGFSVGGRALIAKEQSLDKASQAC